MTPKIRSVNRFQWGRTLAASALIALGVCASLYFSRSHTHAIERIDRISAGQEVSAPVVRASTSSAVVAVPLATNAAKTSNAAEVDHLIATHDAHDAFTAYQLIRTCLNARRDQLVVAEWVANNDKSPVLSVGKSCGDLSPGQIASRIQYLGVAAKAGVHGAAGALADEGPRGEGVVLGLASDDPEQIAYVQAVKEAVEAGAARGDYWSLLSMSNRYEFVESGNPDYLPALKYFVAADDAYRQEHGTDLKSFKGGLNRFKVFVPQDQVETAIQSGHELFQNTQGTK